MNTVFLVKYLLHGGHVAEEVPLRLPARAPRRRLLGDEEGARRLSVHPLVYSFDCGVRGPSRDAAVVGMSGWVDGKTPCSLLVAEEAAPGRPRGIGNPSAATPA